MCSFEFPGGGREAEGWTIEGVAAMDPTWGEGRTDSNVVAPDSAERGLDAGGWGTPARDAGEGALIGRS